MHNVLNAAPLDRAYDSSTGPIRICNESLRFFDMSQSIVCSMDRIHSDCFTTFNKQRGSKIRYI